MQRTLISQLILSTGRSDYPTRDGGFVCVDCHCMSADECKVLNLAHVNSEKIPIRIF